MGAEEGILLAKRYRLLSIVGRGGMGTVWRAHDETLGRDVAVKEVALPEQLADGGRLLRRRLMAEARATVALSHPGVITVYDVVEEDGRPWIVMELLRARSLQQMIDQDGPLEPGRVAEIGRSVLSVLRAAHAAGILHRDVKPSNVLLTEDGRVVLTDFGLAISKREGASPRFRGVEGSPPYVSPEQVRGDSITEASDLWSLGATMYTAVEGHSPYGRRDPLASLIALLIEAYRPPLHAGPLRPVIDGLLTKNPACRMSAERAGRLLDRAVSHSRPPWCRARLQAGALACVMILAAVVAMVGAWSSRWNSVGTGETVSVIDASGRGTISYRGPGFSVDVPADWLRVMRSDGVYWYDPHASHHLRISRAPGDPLHGLKEAEKRGLAAGTFPGYRKLRLEAAPELGPNAAEWEFTWDQGRLRGLDARVSGHDIFFVGLDDHWTPSQRRFDAILQSIQTF
ncbi:serine/threonine-protein kinase [Actinomadura alba]|uniref:non-specific serine/threonine protein kinase n=1 Tax=Actinomadura alba TaxID=406431 RepID=A0ABR7M091_9ACTN|nr:serine/threonine-protein kinase [Actinomadura alba]MBC6470521.1 serine/threonine protein kinase [Actinomadura alba]